MLLSLVNGLFDPPPFPGFEVLKVSKRGKRLRNEFNMNSFRLAAFGKVVVKPVFIL